MKLFKKFFNMITYIPRKIYNSREFEIASFAFETASTTVKWVDATKEFIEQMQLVIASIAVLGKYILKGISNILGINNIKK